MTQASTQPSTQLSGPALLFGAAVLLHIVLLVVMGNPRPGGVLADENSYLELASNLWHHGEYGSRVAIDYPPLYPMLIAPVFALESNELRFAAIHALHGLLLGLGSLLLLPALREALGSTRAWAVLAAAQFLGGATFHGYSTQTESLFAALILAATGTVWLAYRAPSPRRWLALGALCGLAICTRRTGLVLPCALALLWLSDSMTAWRQQAPLPWRVGGLMLLGLALGLLPEGLAMLLAGQSIDTYGGNPAVGHLGAAVDAFGSGQNLVLAFQTTAKHLAYVVLATFGAPIALALLLTSRSDRPPLPTARLASFALLVVLGLVAMTVLHILRFRYGHPSHPGWDLYPRYVDPPELALVLSSVLAAAWLFRPEAPGPAPARLLRRAGPWLAGLGLCAVLAGPVLRPRGGRFRSFQRLVDSLVEGASTHGLAIVCIAVLAAWAAWWWRGRPAGVGTVLLAIVASWTLTLDSGWRRLSGVSSYEPPAVLSLEVLTKSPRAPLAVVVYKRGHGSRPYYEPAFRSEHPLRFVQPGPELREWIQQHPEGFVLLRKKDRMETPSTGVRTVAETRNWLVQQGPSIGADRPRKLPGLRGKSPAPGGAPGRPGGDGSERPPGAQEAADPSEE